MATHILLNAASMIHYGDITKGDVRINTIFPLAPESGQRKKVGLFTAQNQNGIYFEVSGAVFQAVVSDGDSGVSDSEAITWVDEWTDNEIELRIIWSAGRAKFLIDGVVKAEIPFESSIVLANQPMSVYAQNANADDLYIGRIDVIADNYSYHDLNS